MATANGSATGATPAQRDLQSIPLRGHTVYVWRQPEPTKHAFGWRVLRAEDLQLVTQSEADTAADAWSAALACVPEDESPKLTQEPGKYMVRQGEMFPVKLLRDGDYSIRVWRDTIEPETYAWRLTHDADELSGGGGAGLPSEAAALEASQDELNRFKSQCEMRRRRREQAEIKRRMRQQWDSARESLQVSASVAHALPMLRFRLECIDHSAQGLEGLLSVLGADADHRSMFDDGEDDARPLSPATAWQLRAAAAELVARIRDKIDDIASWEPTR